MLEDGQARVAHARGLRAREADALVAVAVNDAADDVHLPGGARAAGAGVKGRAAGARQQVSAQPSHALSRAPRAARALLVSIVTSSLGESAVR